MKIFGARFVLTTGLSDPSDPRQPRKRRGCVISIAMYPTLRRLLFTLEPETAHRIALGVLAKASCSKALCALLNQRSRAGLAAPPHEVMGIEFPNSVGLAAGLDKQGTACNALHALGFGWVELGTVTPLPQPGNPRPRMFRLPEHRAIINRMGFNSDGLARFLENIAAVDRRIIKGINLGKNAATPLAQAMDDYLIGLEAVYTHADYVAINISSPNTRNLRDLQQEDALAPLLGGINRKRMALADATGRRVPLVLKIAPDLDGDAIDHIAALARKHCIDGIAATNTTPTRSGVENHALAVEPGGLSGPPLASLSTATIHRLFGNLQGEIPIIGIGGIDSVDSAVEKFQAGAELVQLYTGFIYHGPKLIREIIKHLNSETASGALESNLRADDRDADDRD